jgi:hypothetical protein
MMLAAGWFRMCVVVMSAAVTMMVFSAALKFSCRQLCVVPKSFRQIHLHLVRPSISVNHLERQQSFIGLGLLDHESLPGLGGFGPLDLYLFGDAVASVNAALETLDSFGFVNVPTLGDELITVSERVDAAQTDVQELRAALEEAKTAASGNLVAALTARTMKLDNRLAQIKSTAVKFQATVEQKQQQVADLSRTVLRAINLLVLSLSVLFLVVTAGQVLLIYVCWQYVRRGRFPLLRVARVDLAAL